MDVEFVTSLTVTITIKNKARPVVEALQIIHLQVSDTLNAFKSEFE